MSLRPQAIGRNFGRDYYVILRKILRVVEALPLTADDVYSVRSAHGTFANVLQVGWAAGFRFLGQRDRCLSEDVYSVRSAHGTITNVLQVGRAAWVRVSGAKRALLAAHCLTVEHVYGVRSAHGTFANVLQVGMAAWVQVSGAKRALLI